MRDLAEVRKELEEFETGEDAFILGVQTDTHYAGCAVVKKDGGVVPPGYDMQKIIRLSEVNKEIKLDAVCNLGDIIRGHSYDTLESTRRDFKDIVGQYTNGAPYGVFLLSGNHDNGVMWTCGEKSGTGNRSIDELFSPEERSGIVIPQMKKTADIVCQKGKLYYYCDLGGIRFIALDTSDCDYKKVCADDIDINHHKISEAQLVWLKDEALKTKLPVVILAHSPLLKELVSENLTIPDNSDKALEIIEGSGREIVAILYGHMHVRSDLIRNGINHITFENGLDKAEILAISLKKKKIKTLALYSGASDREFSF